MFEQFNLCLSHGEPYSSNCLEHDIVFCWSFNVILLVPNSEHVIMQGTHALGCAPGQTAGQTCLFACICDFGARNLNSTGHSEPCMLWASLPHVGMCIWPRRLCAHSCAKPRSSNHNLVRIIFETFPAHDFDQL